ncbi:MAG: hypothetical protein QM731_27910 [Chitinophagaceae bacterium]
MSTVTKLPPTLYLQTSADTWEQTGRAAHQAWEKKLGYVLFFTGIGLYVASTATLLMQLQYTNGLTCAILIAGNILLYKGIVLSFAGRNRKNLKKLFLTAVTGTEYEQLEKKLQRQIREEGLLYILLVITLLLLQTSSHHPFWKGVTEGALCTVSVLLFINTYRIFMYNRQVKKQLHPDSNLNL